MQQMTLSIVPHHWHWQQQRGSAVVGQLLVDKQQKIQKVSDFEGTSDAEKSKPKGKEWDWESSAVLEPCVRYSLHVHPKRDKALQDTYLTTAIEHTHT